MKDDRTIEHSRHERRPTNTVWWVLWAIIGALWALTLFGAEPIQWPNVLLALGTGCALACWAIEITGNKVPESWTRNRRGS